MTVGVIASSWGGTAIQVWMSQQSLKACGGDAFRTEYTNIHHMLGANPNGLRLRVAGGPPTAPSTLWNNMMYPLLTTVPTAVLWYQGESNSGQPDVYERCFPAMIEQWRTDWSAHSGGQSDPQMPFLFFQVSSWPDQDIGIIARLREAQMSATQLPKVGYAVTCDLGDPAGRSVSGVRQHSQVLGLSLIHTLVHLLVPASTR